MYYIESMIPHWLQIANSYQADQKCNVCQGTGHLAKDCPIEEEKRAKYMQNGAKMAEQLMNPELGNRRIVFQDLGYKIKVSQLLV